MVGCLSPKKFCWLNLNRQIYMSNPTCFPVNFRCLSVGHHKKIIFTAERPWIRSDKLTMFPAEKRPQCSVCLKTGYIPQMLMVNPPFRPEHGFNMVSGYCNHHAFHIFPMKNAVNTSFITMFSETYRKITHIFSIFSGFSGQKLQVDLQLRLAYLQRLGSLAFGPCGALGSGGPIPPCRCRPSDLWRRVRHMTTWCRVPGGESEWKWRLLVDVDD